MLTDSLTLCAVSVLALGWIAQPAVGAAIRMWSKSVVDRDQIRVEDVAEVLNAVSGQAGRYGAVVIKPAPLPGQDTEVALDDVREALIRAGANPIEFTLRGAVRCQVVRPLTLRVVDRPDQQPAPSRWWWPGGEQDRPDEASGDDQPHQVKAVVPDEITVVASPSVEPAVTLESVVQAYVSARLARLGGQIHLRFSPNARKALSLAKPAYDFRIHWRGERRLGSCSLDVDVLQDGKLKQTVPMVVEVSATLPVVVAARPISRGQVVRTQDVGLEDRDFFHLDRIGLTDLSPVVGQQTRRFVRKGEMIRHRDLKPQALVDRGDLVTVWSEVGGLRIKTVAKALASGTYGDTIEVRNEASRETFQVTVIGPQTGRLGGSVRRVSMAPRAVGGRP